MDEVTVLLGALGGGAWEPVTGGASGAGVFRSADGTRCPLCVPAGRTAEWEAERHRRVWLGGQGVRCPPVLGWLTALATGADAGVPADRRPAACPKSRRGTARSRAAWA